MRSQPRFFPVPQPNHSAQRLDIHRGISPHAERYLPWLNVAWKATHSGRWQLDPIVGSNR